MKGIQLLPVSQGHFVHLIIGRGSLSPSTTIIRDSQAIPDLFINGIPGNGQAADKILVTVKINRDGSGAIKDPTLQREKIEP